MNVQRGRHSTYPSMLLAIYSTSYGIKVCTVYFPTPCKPGRHRHGFYYSTNEFSLRIIALYMRAVYMNLPHTFQNHLSDCKCEQNLMILNSSAVFSCCPKPYHPLMHKCLRLNVTDDYKSFEARRSEDMRGLILSIMTVLLYKPCDLRVVPVV